jgi:hypothetical protein
MIQHTCKQGLCLRPDEIPDMSVGLSMSQRAEQLLKALTQISGQLNTLATKAYWALSTYCCLLAGLFLTLAVSLGPSSCCRGHTTRHSSAHQLGSILTQMQVEEVSQLMGCMTSVRWWRAQQVGVQVSQDCQVL